MNLSKTAQYAIRILSFMAVKKQSLYPASWLVEELQISDKYLKHLMTSMAKAGLVMSTRGRHGGFRLNKKPEEIFLNDIINSVDNEVKYNGCVLGFDRCSDENPCAIHYEWIKVKKEMDQLFNTVTLGQIAAKENINKF